MISIVDFKNHESQKLIKTKLHPTKDLIMWNYSSFTVRKRKWDDITRMSRCLVTTNNGEIKARSFERFDNEKNNNLLDYEIFEKFDGSLCILFFVDEWIVASRNSFVSFQIDKAKELLENIDLNKLDKSLTYNFELIHPDNKIILDYGNKKSLIFLASFDINGIEYTDFKFMKDIGFETAVPLEKMNIEDLKELNINNKEGFIIRYSNGKRLKIKFEKYFELSRLNQILNTNEILSKFEKGISLEKIKNTSPRGIHDLIEEKYKQIEDEYIKISEEVKSKMKEINSNITKKDLSIKFNDYKYLNILFFMYDKKDPRSLILKKIKQNNNSL